MRSYRGTLRPVPAHVCGSVRSATRSGKEGCVIDKVYKCGIVQCNGPREQHNRADLSPLDRLEMVLHRQAGPGRLPGAHCVRLVMGRRDKLQGARRQQVLPDDRPSPRWANEASRLITIKSRTMNVCGKGSSRTLTFFSRLRGTTSRRDTQIFFKHPSKLGYF